MLLKSQDLTRGIGTDTHKKTVKIIGCEEVFQFIHYVYTFWITMTKLNFTIYSHKDMLRGMKVSSDKR